MYLNETNKRTGHTQRRMVALTKLFDRFIFIDPSLGACTSTGGAVYVFRVNTLYTAAVNSTAYSGGF